MAAPVTQQFLDEQARTTREPKKKVLMRLRNVASNGMGSVASSPHTLDADHPPAGAIDDDLTHINYGPASGADNGIGLSGWKSSDAGVEDDWDTDAERLDDAIAADATGKMATVFSSGTEVLANTKHNILLRSEEFDNAGVWVPTAITVIANNAEAPDGTTTAERLDEIPSTNRHGLMQSIAKTAGGLIPASFFVKAGTRTWCYIEVGATLAGPNNIRQFFDVATPAVGSTIINGAGWSVIGTPSVRPVRGRPGWMRVEVVVAAPSATVAGAVGIFASTGDTVETYLGVVGQNIFVWGGQALDDGENPGPYTKTIASAVWAHGADFETLTPATQLATQRTWLAGARIGAGLISVEAGVGHAGAQGVQLNAPPAAIGQDNVSLPLPIMPQGLVVFQFWASMREGGKNTDEILFMLIAPGIRLFALGIDAASVAPPVAGAAHWLRLAIGAGAKFQPDDSVIIQDDEWNQFTIVVDRTTPLTSDIRVFHRRETGVGVFEPEVHWECWRGTVDTTNLSNFQMRIDNQTPGSAPSPLWWFDQLMIHTGHEAESVYAQLLNIGATPTGTAATVTLEAGAEPIRRIAPGASYAFSNAAGLSRVFRFNTATTATGQTFTPTTNAQIDALRIRVQRVGSPEGNMWAEIRALSGGVPTADILARSIARPAMFDMTDADMADLVFEFPQPFVPDGSSTYAIQFVADWPIDGVNYVSIATDQTGTYAGGQKFTVDDEPWGTPVYTFQPGDDIVFIMYTHHRILETFDKATIDTDIKLQDDAALFHIGQGFEVDRTVSFQHLHVAVKALVANTMAQNFIGLWFDLHADDGSGEKPSNTVLARGAWADAANIRWTAGYEWFGLRLVTRYTLQPGVRYWWILKASEDYDTFVPGVGSDTLAFGADDSSPSYARGNRAFSNDADPKVWTAVTGGAMAFRIMELERPHFQIRANYSADDITYGAEAVLADNERRLTDPSGSFTGEEKQFWLARAVAVCMGGSAEFGPSATDLLMRNVHAVERELTIDFGQQREIDLVRLFAHPTEGGLNRARIETSTDGIGFTPVPAYDPETIESYSQGKAEDQGSGIISASEGAYAQEWLEDFEGYSPGDFIEVNAPWRKTAGTPAQGNLQAKADFGPIEGTLSALVNYSSSTIGYAADFPNGRTERAYRFDWNEKRTFHTGLVVRSLRFADQADTGADAWAIETSGGPADSDIRVRDALGLSGVVFNQLRDTVIVYRVEVDTDLTLRFYADSGAGFVLKYTGVASFRQADRLLIGLTAQVGADSFPLYDLLTLSQRVRVPAVLTNVWPPVVAGEYLGAQFAATITASHIKIVVLESDDGFARLLEVQVFRVVDVSDRVVEMTESQSAGFLLLRMKQRTLSLVLKNVDRALSKLNPNGPYFGQLGGGVEFTAYMGYLGAPDMVKQGVFYVDTWAESAKGTEIIIGATDGVKRIDTDVLPNHRVRPRHVDIMEYLANLTNLPSQWQAIERAAGIVDYFAADRANAWEELQKIGEATGGSRVWFDRQGRLRMRLTGSSAADSRIATLFLGQVPPVVFMRAYGPPVFIGTKMYVAVATLFVDGTGEHEQLKVVEYDTEAGTWRFIAGGLPINSVPPIGVGETGEQQGQAMLHVFDGELFAIFHYNATGTLGLQIVKWDGAYVDTGKNWQTLYQRGDAEFGNYQEDIGGNFLRQVHPRAMVRNHLFTFGADSIFPSHHRFNMYNMWHVLLGGANSCDGAVAVPEPDGDFAYFTRRVQVGPDFDLRIARIRAERLSVIAAEQQGMVFADRIPDMHTGVEFFTMGLTVDDNGNLLTSLIATTGTLDGTILQQHRTGGTVTQSPAFYDRSESSIENNARNGLAILSFDDLVITGGQRSLVSGPELHVAMWDRALDEVVDVGNISMSNTRIIGFAKTTVEGQDVFYAIVDEGRVIEVYVRRRLPIQATPIHSITDGIDGAFQDATIEGGDDDGESRIINTAIINSNPLVLQPTEKVWEGRGLPWPTTSNTNLVFSCRLREAALPFDAADVTSQRATLTFLPAPPPHTIELSPHHKRPKLKVTFGLAFSKGQVTGCEINGVTLKKNSSLVGIVVGHKSSFARFDVRRRSFDNDYIFDNFAQSVVGASVVARHQFERLRVAGVSIRALWDIEMFDLLTLRETERLFVDGVFYMVKFTRAYHGSQQMSLGLEEGVV